VFVRLAASSPSPRKVALKRWTEGYLPPGNPLFFAETDVRFRGIVLKKSERDLPAQSQHSFKRLLPALPQGAIAEGLRESVT